MNSSRKQSGMTAMGIVLLLAVIGIFAITAIQLTPVYLEFQAIATIMNGITKEPKNSSPGQLRGTIEKRLDVNNVTVVTPKDFKFSKKTGVMTVSIEYNAEAPFMSNVYFLVKFNKEVQVTGT